MAEDEEDQAFGDFKFSTYPIQAHAPHPNQINFQTSPIEDDDDDWGDFVNHSSQIANGFSSSKSPPNSSDAAESGKSRWVKPHGALPLSLFGEAEEEEVVVESSVGGFAFGSGVHLFSGNDVGSFKKGSDMNGGVGVSDLIKNLYGVEPQIKADNGLNSQSDANGINLDFNSLNSKSEGFKRNSDGSHLNLNGANPNANASNFDFGSMVNTNVLDLNPAGSNSGLGGASSDFDGDDVDWWEFKAADAETAKESRSSKVESSGLNAEAPRQMNQEIQADRKAWNNFGGAAHAFGFGADPLSTPGDLSNTSNGIELGFGFHQNTSIKAEDGTVFSSFSKNKQSVAKNGSDPSRADENADFGDWEFKDAFSGTGPNNALEDPEFAYVTPPSVESLTLDSSKSHNSESGSNDTSKSSAEWDFGFHMNPGSVAKESIIPIYMESSLNDTAKDSPVPDTFTKNRLNYTEKGLVTSVLDRNDKSDDNFGEFKDVVSRTESNNVLEDPKVAAVPSPGVEVLTVDNGKFHNSINPLSASNGISNKSAEWDFDFHFHPSSASEDSIIPTYKESSLSDTVKDSTITDSGMKSSSNDPKKGLNSSVIDKNVKSDENFWEFKDAFSESGSNNKGEATVATESSSIEETPAFSTEIERKVITSSTHREALPLSIFGDATLENSGSSSIDENIINHTPGSYQISSSRTLSSTMSINDLISSLYTKADQNSSTNHTTNAMENGVQSNPAILQLEVVYDYEDFDNDSWKFKNAVSDTTTQDPIPTNNLGVLPEQSSTQLQLNDYVDLYLKLNDEMCSVTGFNNLKDAHRISDFSGEDARAESPYDEILEFCNRLLQDEKTRENFKSENLSSRTSGLDELLQLLQESRFRVLESEYELSRRLLLAEKDLRSAIGLLQHAVSTLRILKLRSVEEQSDYVSAWYEMVSVCYQELKHGTLIWKQSLQKKIGTEILSDPKGKQYILALGEINRVVEVLGASAKLYKPWILLSSVDYSGSFSLLSECSALWSSSGLNEALHDISDTVDVKVLLDSINYIHDLDELTLQSHVLSGKQPPCHLSGLTAETLPDMEMVVWNGENYFLKLVNLWANLVRRDRPLLLPTEVS